jgi:hypothetical protein
MLKNSSRICDVCGGKIPKGTTYRAATITQEAAMLFLSITDIDLLPTWTQNLDGTVRLDICLDCHLSMGTSIKTREEN